MMTAVAPKKTSRKARSLAAKATKSVMKPARLVVCGPAKRVTRDEIMAEDAAFLQKMQGDHLAAKTSVELVREDRRVSNW